MLLFCPACSNMLTISKPDPSTPYAYQCRTCPYQYTLTRPHFESHPLTRPKQPSSDILGGANAWENVDRTGVPCADDKCTGTEAFFMQVQIRSADEPMTNFYRCCECGREWRD